MVIFQTQVKLEKESTSTERKLWWLWRIINNTELRNLTHLSVLPIPNIDSISKLLSPVLVVAGCTLDSPRSFSIITFLASTISTIHLALACPCERYALSLIKNKREPRETYQTKQFFRLPLILKKEAFHLTHLISKDGKRLLTSMKNWNMKALIGFQHFWCIKKSRNLKLLNNLCQLLRWKPFAENAN